MTTYFRELIGFPNIFKSMRVGAIVAIVLGVLDIQDIPSRMFIDKFDVALVSIGLFLLVIVLSILVENHFLDAVRIPVMNEIDLAITAGILFILFYGAIVFFADELFQYKCCALFTLLLIIFVCTLMRAYYFRCASKNANLIDPHFIDLKDLYENRVRAYKDELLLLEEKAVDYDLLGREGIVDQLYQTVTTNSLHGSFVVSLEGKWGSGKSTILSILKKTIESEGSEIIIIDDYDPWPYDDKTTLLVNLLDLLFVATGYKYRLLSTRKLAESFSSLVLGTDKHNAMSSLVKGMSPDNLKDQINAYINRCGKKIVFFIDNLDRAESQNVILLFKLIGSVLNFDKITYVLSFDPVTVQEIFDDAYKGAGGYLDKIVQVSIRLPDIDKRKLREICQKSIENLLLLYDKDAADISKYEGVITHLCDIVADLRDFKRFINSALFFSLFSFDYLYSRDLLAIHIIQFFNYPLYVEIFEKKEFFISHDKDFMEEHRQRLSYDAKIFNEEGKKYFSSLFDHADHGQHKYLLGDIFPYVKRFLNNQNLEPGFSAYKQDPEYTEIARNKRICNAQYFDLYFTKTKNAYSELAQLTDEFVDSFLKEPSYERRNVLLESLLELIPHSSQKQVFARVQLLLTSLSSGAQFDLMIILLNNLPDIEDSTVFLTASGRVELIIIELLREAVDDSFKEFIAYAKTEYGRLGTLQRIANRINHDTYDDRYQDRQKQLKQMIKAMTEEILEGDIDLYEDNHYMKRNIWALRGESEEIDDVFKAYLRKMVNENNIFRFLCDNVLFSYDLIPDASDRRYSYRLSPYILETGFTIDEIDVMLSATGPKSNDQILIQQMYQQFKDNRDDPEREEGVMKFKTPKEFEL